jgi:hypothetical protein
MGPDMGEVLHAEGGGPEEARGYYEQTLEDLDAAEHARLLEYLAEERRQSSRDPIHAS